MISYELYCQIQLYYKERGLSFAQIGRELNLDEETVDSVLSEAGRFASDVIAPLNRVGDKFGTPFKDGNVTTPPGWKEAYTTWAAAGWNGLAAPADWGGQELPHALNAACVEMWNSASMAFGIGPVLTSGQRGNVHAGNVDRQWIDDHV